MRLGVIGYGTRSKDVISAMQKVDSSVMISSVYDFSTENVKRDMLDNNIDINKIAFYESIDDMLNSNNLDGVIIGTRCDSHTEYAVKVLPTGIPLFMEKPVATNMSDLLRLKEGAQKAKSPVVVSFPLRVTPQIALAKEMIDSGKIGSVEHVQAVNDCSYGGVYFHNWYRDEKVTGGLFLQKATHDFDYINYVLGIKPVMICAMNSKQIFKGDKPEGLLCRDCEVREDCLESTYGKPYSKGANQLEDGCVFAKDTGNEDSGTAIIRYETGMHAVYSQNFFVRQKSGIRGARFMGYKGTIEFDWYSNEFRVHMNHTPRIEIHKMDVDENGHGGGDFALARNFIDIMKGKTSKSVSDLDAGLLSVLMCLKAKESSQTNQFKDIVFPAI